MTTRKFLKKIYQITSEQCEIKKFMGEPNYPPEYYIDHLNPAHDSRKEAKLVSLMNYCIGCGYIYCEMTSGGLRVNISPYGYSRMFSWKDNIVTVIVSILTGSVATCLGALLSFFLAKQ